MTRGGGLVRGGGGVAVVDVVVLGGVVGAGSGVPGGT